jgi:hypothetical protein
MLCLTALILPSLLGSAQASEQEPAEPVAELKDADHRKLGRHLGKWFAAKVDGDYDKIEAAKADLISDSEDFEKKLKNRSILSLVRDWEIVLEVGREFDTSGPEIKKGKAYEVPLPNDAGKCGIRLPAAYNPKKENYPGILVLTSGKITDALEALPEEFKDRYILIGVDLTGLDADSLFSDAGRLRMILPIGTASRLFRLDRRRLFLLGQGSLGARAASRLAAVYPVSFAACALVGGVSAATTNAGNLNLLPFTTKGDTVGAFAWFAEQPPRQAYPLTLDVTLTESWQGRYYWLQALRFDPPDAVPAGKVARFKASVDRATNTITIDSEFVYAFMIFLNDQIVNLDQPVKVVRNGETHTFQAARSVGTLLDNYESTLDAGMVFPAVIRRVDVPTPASPQVRTR